MQVARVQLHDEKPSSLGRLFPAVFLAILFILLLCALVTGVHTYSTVAGAQTSSNAAREGLQLIANSVRANDAKDSIAVGEGPEGRSLVVVERLESGTFEIRTYLYQGNVVQEYALSGNPYSPVSATVLCASDTFDLPHPFGPTMPITVPCVTSKETPRRALTSRMCGVASDRPMRSTRWRSVFARRSRTVR